MPRRRKSKARRVRDTHARLALREWLAAEDAPTQTALAESLGVEQPLISQWLKGTARPSPVLREALEIMCSIPQSDWLDASERVHLQQLRAAG